MKQKKNKRKYKLMIQVTINTSNTRHQSRLFTKSQHGSSIALHPHSRTAISRYVNRILLIQQETYNRTHNTGNITQET